MPADDYTAAVSGGLKLKNVSSSSKVSKSHRKKRPKSSQPESSANANESANAEKSVDVEKDDGGDVRDDQDDDTIDKSKQVLGDGAATSPPRAGKTEAELRHEEHRRKRLDERLKREGTKTHKERVEELNRYLSNLSLESDPDKTGTRQTYFYIMGCGLLAEAMQSRISLFMTLQTAAAGYLGS